MDFLKIKSEKSFEELSIELFNFHYDQNESYREFCDSIKVNYSEVDCIENISRINPISKWHSFF